MSPARPDPAALAELLGRVARAESGRILAGLIGRTGGDFERAEEAFQDACVEALEHWPAAGVPENPGAWLATTALRKAIDRARRERLRSPGESSGSGDEPAPDERERLEAALESSVRDDLLRLVFTCCHPSLALEGRVALTLRTLGGLTTAEIARAFLISEDTMTQRLVRAQRKIREAGIPYRIPREDELALRLDAVLAVLYLVFNEGYSASRGVGDRRVEGTRAELVRVELCAEAIRLARLVAAQLPSAAEAQALLALFLLQHARRDTRTDADGTFVPLERQERARWDRAAIEEALRILAALAPAERSSYSLQAAIAAEHARAARAADTDWPAIVSLYRELERLRPSPVVSLNRAAAQAMAEGAERGLAEVERIQREVRGALDDYLWLHTLRGELLARCGRREPACSAFRRALEIAGTEPERRHIARRLAELSAP